MIEDMPAYLQEFQEQLKIAVIGLFVIDSFIGLYVGFFL